jgi:hypothetical protein
VARAGAASRLAAEAAIRYVADMLGIAHIRGEVATFHDVPIVAGRQQGSFSLRHDAVHVCAVRAIWLSLQKPDRSASARTFNADSTCRGKKSVSRQLRQRR